MTTIADNQRLFTEALMLSIIAPDDEKYEKALGLVARIAPTLTEDEQELCKMGIEVCMEYLKKS